MWTTIIELDCDGEPCWSGPYRADTGIKENARDEAAKAGWSYDPVTDEDFCRKCTKLKSEGN